MGHKRTIRPNARKLSTLFMGRNQMDWETFSKKVKSYQRGFMGEPDELRLGRGEFHELPSSCICEKRSSENDFGKDEDHSSKQEIFLREPSVLAQ